MLLHEYEHQRRRFQRIVFASLAVIALFIYFTSYALFARGLAFFLELHVVVSLFALIPVSAIALLLSIVFRKMNAQLYREAEGMRALIESSPIGIFALDRHGMINLFNGSMGKIWNMPVEDMDGVSVFSRQSYIDERVDELLRVGLGGVQFEEEVKVIANGLTHWHWYRGIPIRSEHAGRVEFLLVMVQDITNRKQMQNELASYATQLEKGLQEQLEMLQVRTNELEHTNEDSENTKKALLNVLEDTRHLESRLREEHDRLQSIVTSMGEGVVVTDKDGKITFVNTAAQNLLEMSPQEISHISIFDVVSVVSGPRKEPVEESSIRKSLRVRSIERVSMRDEQYWKTRSGRLFPVALVASPMLSEEFRGAVVVFRDISDDKQLDEAKTNFISIASHQLRTPLTAIRWLSELLSKEGKGKMEPQLEMYVDDIHESAYRMIALVNSLLNVSRIEAGRMRVSASTVKFEEVIQGVIDELGIAARGSRCTILFRKPRKALPKIALDVSLIRQVVQNLLTNAIRYSRPEHCEITVEVSLEDRHILMSVHDTGIGIPPEAQGRIFEKFYRASNASKKQTDGTGLGLYISKLISEMAGGRIWFESIENKGTTFFVTLPLRGMKSKEGDVALVNEPK